MANEYLIGLRITFTSDDAALQQAVKQLRVLEDRQQRAAAATAKARTAMSGFGASLKDVARNIVGPIATIGGLVTLLWKGAQAALEKAKAVRQLSNTVDSFGQDGRAAAAAAAELGDALEKVGLDDAEVIAATRDLTRITGDYREALSAASLAADVSTKTGLSYGESLAIIQGLLIGSERGVVAAHRELGVQAATADEALRKVDQTFRGYAETVRDAASEAAAAKAKFDNLWESLGAPLATAGATAIKVFKTLAQGLAMVGGAAYTAWLEIKNVPANIADALAGNSKDVVDRQRATAAEVAAVWDQLWADMRTIWTTSGPDVSGLLGRAGAVAPKVHPRSEGGESQAKIVETDAAEMQKALDALRAQWERALDELLATRIAHAKAMGAARAQQLALELQALDVAQAKDIEAVKGNAEAKFIVEQTYALRRQLLYTQTAQAQARDDEDAARQQQAIREALSVDVRTLDESQLEAHREYLARLLKSEKLTADQIVKIKAGIAATDIALTVAGEQQKTQARLAAAANAIGALQGVFQQSKALSAALSLIYALQAAAGAAAETHGDVFTRIAAYATAFAYVIGAYRAIRGTEMSSGGEQGGRAAGGGRTSGRGFDDPMNDRIAYLGGRKWAADMVANISRGWADAMPQVVQQGAARTTNVTTQTVDNSRGASVVVNQSILWGPSARDGAKQISRLIDRGSARAKRTRIGAGAKLLGGE